MTRVERDFLAFHLWFVVFAALAIAVPADVRHGWRAVAIVAGYVVAVPFVAGARRHREWYGLWSFGVLVSALLLVPLRVLTEVLGVLAFPADGVPDIGGVTAYAAFMWVLPLFVITFIGRSVDARQGRGPAYVAVLLTSVAIFVGVAQWLVDARVWHPVGVSTIGNVATYLVLAEVLLGVSAYYAYEETRDRWALVRIPAAVVVALLYLGAAIGGWFLLERL